MYAKREEYLISNADGLPISVLTVLPEKKPYCGIVQLVHGMCEYKERYMKLMEYLASQGYVAVIHDHRGHGKSVRSKEDLGYTYGGGAEAMLSDIALVNTEVRERYPELPLILMGHSMGSLAVRAFAAKHDDCMDMLIVCGSPSKNPARAAGTLVAKAEQKLRGGRHRSRLLESLSFGSYAARFRDEKSKHAWVCSDPEVYREYGENELCGFTFTDDGYLALFELMRQTYDVKHWDCKSPKMPVLFIAGEKDPCIGNVRQFASAVRSMRSAGYLDVKGKLYPGMRHEILNEVEKEKVYHDIVVYMKKKGF